MDQPFNHNNDVHQLNTNQQEQKVKLILVVAIGGTLGVVLVLILLFCFLKRKQQRQLEQKNKQKHTQVFINNNNVRHFTSSSLASLPTPSPTDDTQYPTLPSFTMNEVTTLTPTNTNPSIFFLNQPSNSTVPPPFSSSNFLNSNSNLHSNALIPFKKRLSYDMASIPIQDTQEAFSRQVHFSLEHTTLLHSWHEFLDSTFQLFQTGFDQRPPFTATPLTLFQTLTQYPSHSSSSLPLPFHPSAQVYAFLFYISDVFFGHFLKTKLISENRMLLYSHFIFQYHPTWNQSLASSSSSFHPIPLSSFPSSPTSPLLTSEIWLAMSDLLSCPEVQDLFFHSYIKSDILMCVQDLCRLSWAYDIAVNVEEIQRFVEKGIHLFFQFKAFIPTMVWFFPSNQTYIDPERMQWKEYVLPLPSSVASSSFTTTSTTSTTNGSTSTLPTTSVPNTTPHPMKFNESKVMFTYWPGILDAETGEIIEKAWVWYT